MKRLFFLAILISKIYPTFSQTQLRQVEIEPFLRWDNYPQFTNAINNIATYKLSIKGNSWGLNIAYKIPLKNNFLVKAGLGFFEYSFSKIESTHATFGKGSQRIINYPTTLGITLGTDKYWYTTISLSIGIEKSLTLKKNFQITSGITFKNYFTISQQYHLPYDNTFIPNPSLQIQNNFKTNNDRYFGLATEFQVGVLKKLGKVSIGPSLIIPFYDFWRQDEIFPSEMNSNKRSKWFRGIGTGIICNYSLKKNKHHAN